MTIRDAEGEATENIIQKSGARARAYGRSIFDNPFLRIKNLPGNTGETREQWRRKHDLWHLGWTAEDAMRSGKS